MQVLLGIILYTNYGGLWVVVKEHITKFQQRDSMTCLWGVLVFLWDLMTTTKLKALSYNPGCFCAFRSLDVCNLKTENWGMVKPKSPERYKRGVPLW